MSKRSSILCCGLCLAMILTACIPQPPTSDATPTATKPHPTATAEQRTPTATKLPDIDVDLQKLKGLQLTYLHPWSGETGRMMDVLVDEFNQSNEWGIHVMLREPGSMGLAIEELENPDSDAESIDLAALPVYELLNQDVNQFKVQDLNLYAHSSKYGFSEEQIKDFMPDFWNENLVDGKLYGIPAQETASVLFYNATWAAELGYSKIPLTVADFKTQTCAANASFRKDADSSNDGVGGWIINEDADAIMNWLKTFNAVNIKQALEEFTSAQTVTAFTYLFNLQKDACAWDSRLPEPYDYFANRQALAYSGTLQDIKPQTAAFERIGSEDQWQVVLYPSASDATLLTEGISYGVFESNEEKQLASWLFIRWVSQPENQVRLLKTSGTFPLSTSVITGMTDYKKTYPQWGEAVSLLPFASPTPAQTNFRIIQTVLGDAATFLFKPEFTIEQLPALLEELDATIQDLTDRQE